MDEHLESAVLGNNVALLTGLIKAGVPLSERTARGWTLLHLAADRYSVDAARVLLDHGLDVNAQDICGNTPLMRAVYRSKRGTELEFIKLLMSRGADPGIKNKAGESARDFAKGNPALERLVGQEHK